MSPLFERADRKELEAAADALWKDVKGVTAKVVKGKDKPEPETSDTEVETK